MSRRRRTGGATLKRSGPARDLGPAVCHGCPETIDAKLAWRSRIWAFGVAGVHFLYCSRDCRELNEGTLI